MANPSTNEMLLQLQTALLQLDKQLDALHDAGFSVDIEPFFPAIGQRCPWLSVSVNRTVCETYGVNSSGVIHADTD